MEPPPTVRKRGLGPTGTSLTTLLAVGSTRASVLPALQVIQMESLAKIGLNDPGGMRICAAMPFVAGSMRARSPSFDVTIHTLPAPVAIPPSESAGLAAIVASNLPVCALTRTNE